MIRRLFNGILNRWSKASSLRHLTCYWPTMLITQKRLVTMRLHAHGTSLLMSFRRNTSDSAILKEVLSSNVYESSKYHDAPCVLIDLGSHIGSFTNLFLSTHPHSRAICIEPNPFSYSLLIQNLHANQILDRATCLSAAIVPHQDLVRNRFVRLDFPAGQTDVFEQFQVSPSGRWVTMGVSLRDISELHAENIPLVLKMDIEGAELPLLDELLDMLQKAQVFMLFMEFHGTQPQLLDWISRLEHIGFNCVRNGLILRAEKELSG